MSRIYFHSPSDTAEVLGSERAWMGMFINDIAGGLLGHRWRDDRLYELLPQGHYLRQMNRDGQHAAQWNDSYRLSFTVSGDTIEWRGQPIDGFSLALNMVMAIGNDAARLIARLHAQCEIHAWVDGPDRAWFADLIEQGREAEMLRAGVGWEATIEFLRSRDDEPVVTSYSVCDQFPNSYVSDWEPISGPDEDEDEARDAWYDLPDQEKWTHSMSALRKERGGLQMTPAGWSDLRFSHRLSVLDLYADDWTERLDRAVEAVAASA